jgi:cytochrome o ubiquinol oxidase subunit 2
MFASRINRLFFLTSMLLLGGCNTIVMNPSGYIANQQSNLIVTAIALLSIIIVPVIICIIVFAWRYRITNVNAVYDPEWDHSTKLEFLIWGAPLVIIIILGVITWITTHNLDPYRPLDRIDANRSIPQDVRPLIVEVVALDWKWLFIYPEQGVASINELVVPVDRPVKFKITASTVMNSFYIPAMAGQIYAMPGMETQLNSIINKAGKYDGFSANYSGAGFSDMRFKMHGVTPEGFSQWVKETQATKQKLDIESYEQIVQPSIKVPVSKYGAIDENLYGKILNRCLVESDSCMK